jgi:aspartate/methionine/tyrosine aminotransferase
MPRFPSCSSRSLAVSATPFGRLSPRAAKKRAEGRLFPFHLGDSHLLPAAAARRLDLDEERLHRYCPVAGLPEYRAGVAAWLAPQLGLPLEEAHVVAAPGCTGALSLVATALADPGDEVLLVTPCWPLFAGILRSQGLRPVSVPIGDDGWPEAAGAGPFRRRLEEAVTGRTVALYFCDPNNPSGYVMPRTHLEAIAAVAGEHGLWLIVDIVYKDLLFPPARWEAPLLAAHAERLVLAGSFSKSHLLAGHRAGFTVSPPEVAHLLGRAICHGSYHASTSAQRMALAALGAGAAEIERVRASYEEGAAAALSALGAGAPDGAAWHALPGGARVRAPESGAFLFLDLRSLVADADEALAFFAECLEAGVALAPGEVFGAGFERFARLCFTANPPEVVRAGCALLAERLAAWRR